MAKSKKVRSNKKVKLKEDRKSQRSGVSGCAACGGIAILRTLSKWLKL